MNFDTGNGIYSILLGFLCFLHSKIKVTAIFPRLFVFVCLEFIALALPSRFFHSNGGVTITCEGLQSFTYDRRLLRNIECFSSACHTCFHETRVVGHLRQPWHSNLLTSVWHWNYHYTDSSTSFNNLGLSRPGFEPPTFRMRGKCSNRMRYSRGPLFIVITRPPH